MDDHVANAKEPMMMEEGTTVKPAGRRSRAAGCCGSVSIHSSTYPGTRDSKLPPLTDPGVAPFALKIFSKSCSFQVI